MQRTDSFAVGDGPTLVVNNENGSVTVTAATAGTIEVRATLRRPSRIEYDIVQDGDVVTVTVAIDDGPALLDWSKSPGATLEITVPANTALEVSTSNGGVAVSGIRQSGRLVASNGTIEVTDFEGDLVAETNNGSIELTGYRGSAELDTSNGHVDLKNVIGAFDASNSNGRILFAGEFAPGGTNLFIKVIPKLNSSASHSRARWRRSSRENPASRCRINSVCGADPSPAPVISQ